MDCRSDSEGKTDEGSGYDKRNVKDNPSSPPTAEVPKGKPCKVGAFLVRGRTALPSATPTKKVENVVTVSLSGDTRRGFLHFAYGYAVRFGRNDIKKSQIFKIDRAW